MRWIMESQSAATFSKLHGAISKINTVSHLPLGPFQTYFSQVIVCRLARAAGMNGKPLEPRIQCHLHSSDAHLCSLIVQLDTK